MSITPNTLTNLNAALQHLNLPTIDQAEGARIVDHIGIQPLQGQFSAAKSGDTAAKVAIHQLVLASKSVAYMEDIGKPDATLAVIHEMVVSLSYPAVREIMVNAGEGDASASRVIDQWIERVSGQAGSERPVDELSDPLHCTDVPPPTQQQQRDSAVPAARRSQDNARTASSTRPQAQAYRASGEPGTRTPATRGNVSRLPTGSQRTRPQEHRHELDDDDASTSSRDNGPRENSRGQGGANDGQDDQQRQYDQHSCYGKDVAATFERTPNLRRTSNTVNIKVAKAKFAGKTCKEGVDWQNAITVMLEPHEVQLVYAVLMGIGPKCRFAGHGRDNSKWFEFSETEGEYAGSVRLTMAHGSDRRSINISFTDIKEVCEIFSRTLQDQAKGQSPVFQLAEVRRVYDLYAKKEAVKEARGGGGGGGQQRSAQGGRRS